MFVTNIAKTVWHHNDLNSFLNAIAAIVGFALVWHFFVVVGYPVIPAISVILILLIDSCILLCRCVMTVFGWIKALFSWRPKPRRPMKAPLSQPQTPKRPKPPPPTPQELADMLHEALDQQLGMIEASGLPPEDQTALRNDAMEMYRRRLQELL